MSSFFLLPLFLFTIWQGGALVVSRFLGERRPLIVASLGGLVGLFLYTVSVNALGYILPIRMVFWLMFFLFGVSALFWLKPITARESPESAPYLTRRQRTLLLAAAAVVALLTGLVALHSRHVDDLSLTHLSIASTITEGNFPVRDPSAPDQLVEYHYIPELWSAAFYVIADVPLWVGYDLQKFLFSGLTMLLGFFLAFTLTKGHFRYSFIAALLLFYGGGFSWLNLFNGVQPLWMRFVEGRFIEHPWLFLNDAINPSLNSPFPLFIHNHTPAVGFPLLLLLLYLIIVYLIPHAHKRRVPAALLTALFFGHLALVDETAFAVLAAAFLGLLLLAIVSKYLRSFVPLLLFFLLAGMLFAATQGGLLEQKLRRSDPLGPQAVALAAQPWVLDYHGTRAVLLGPEFFKQFGLPIILFLPALLFFRKDRRIVLLALTAGIAFLVPVMIRYLPGPNQFLRLFHLATPLLAFLAALYLTALLPRYRRAVIIALLLIPASGLLAQSVYLVMPLGKLGRLDFPYFAAPPEPTPLDQEAYDWIRTHTTLKNRFFPYSADFIRDTGRFTPGYFNDEWGYASVNEAERALTEACSPSAAATLGVTHFYVGPSFPMAQFPEICAGKLDLQVVFEARDDSGVRTVYAVRTVQRDE